MGRYLQVDRALTSKPIMNQEVAHNRANMSNLLRLCNAMFSMALGLNVATTTDNQLANAFIKWNLQVMTSVLMDKLLIYNPRKGWGPLCRFLGFYEPIIPFPRCTKMEDYKTSFQLGHFLEKAITITMLVSSVILFFTMPDPFDLFPMYNP